MKNRVTSSRILMLLENNSFPEDRRVALEAQSLVEAGFKVTVICPSGTSRRWSDHAVGAKVYRYPAAWESSGFVGYVWEYAYRLCMMGLLSVFVWMAGLLWMGLTVVLSVALLMRILNSVHYSTSNKER